MKHKFFLASTILLFAVNAPQPSAIAQTAQECQLNEEIFSFQVPTYAIQHQGGAILNIKVAYRLTPEAIAQTAYPDFIPIRKEIDRFLSAYPNETDAWEVVNRNLVQFLLDKYPQMSSLMLELSVMPTPQEAFPRSSIVRRTRPQNCPLTL